MAIFGWNGFTGLSLYLVTLFAVYGTKNAGFKTAAEYEQIQRLAERKAVAGAKGKDQKKQAIAAIRKARLEAMSKAGERYKELAADPEFTKAYGAKEWVR